MKIKISKSQWEKIGRMQKWSRSQKTQEDLYRCLNFIHDASQVLSSISNSQFDREYTDQERANIKSINDDLASLYSRLTALYNPKNLGNI